MLKLGVMTMGGGVMVTSWLGIRATMQLMPWQQHKQLPCYRRDGLPWQH